MGESEPLQKTSPMRIMLVTTGLKLGGAEQQVVALAREFARIGHAVLIVSLTSGNDIPLPGGVAVEILDMRKTPWSTMRALWRARQLVMQWRPDIVHAHMVHANLFARVLTRVADCPPLICTAHSFREGGKARMLAYRLTDGLASLNTHVSNDGRAGMIHAGAASAQRMLVVPNGIDVGRFYPDPGLRECTRAEFGIKPAARLIVSVGRLVPEKSQDLLIRAFGIATTGTDTRLLIAGAGPNRDALQAQVEAAELGHRVALLGARSDVPALLNAADLFVLSSDVEGMPLVLAEAFACGCPVVATDASGVAEVLGELGTIVPRQDARALAGAMSAALTSGRGGPEVEAARRGRVVMHFAVATIARRWLDLYAELAKRAVSFTKNA